MDILAEAVRDLAATPCRFLGEDTKAKAAGDDEAAEDRCLNLNGGTASDRRKVLRGGRCPYAPNDWKGAMIYCKGYKGESND